MLNIEIQFNILIFKLFFKHFPHGDVFFIIILLKLWLNKSIEALNILNNEQATLENM